MAMDRAYSAAAMSILITLLQLTTVSSLSYECNMESVCSAVCQCINDTMSSNFNMKKIECKHLVTKNKTFFSCLSPNVSTVHILGSDISHLFDNDMQNLTHMSTLQIDNSPLEFIGPLAFSGLTSLTVLDIKNTSLTSLDTGVFKGLKLTSLFITDTLLTAITKDHLDPIKTTIEDLQLSRNQIEDFTDNLFSDYNNSLTHLNLAGNRLTTISDSMLANLPNVFMIDLSQNRISSYGPNAFSLLHSLSELDLQGNQLFELAENAFHHSPLQALDLSWNVFEDVPVKAFNPQQTLTTLNMDGNKIIRITNGSLVGLANVTMLHLSQMPSLTTVESNSFQRMDKLQTLYMNYNPNLATMSSNAFPTKMEQLSHLNINDNGLTVLESDMFLNESKLQGLSEVKAEGNPIKCSCNISWIRLEMDNADNTWIQAWKEGETALTCETPSNFNNTEIYAYEATDFTCQNPVILKQDQFSEVNGEQYYMEVLVERGIPTVTWTTLSGMILVSGDVYDPNTGHDIMSVSDELLQNNSVHSRLTIKHPTSVSIGHYTMKATNVAGFTSRVFDAQPPKYNNRKAKTAGLIIGAILGTIILLVVFVCVIRVIRQKPVPYNRMDDSHIQSTDASVPAATGEEQGPFTGSGQRSYGGVDKSTTQGDTQEEPKV